MKGKLKAPVRISKIKGKETRKIQNTFFKLINLFKFVFIYKTNNPIPINNVGYFN